MVWGSRTDKYAKEFQCVLCLYELVFHSALGLETLISISRNWLQKWDTSSDIIITAYLNYNSGENAEIKKIPSQQHSRPNSTTVCKNGIFLCVTQIHSRKK